MRVLSINHLGDMTMKQTYDDLIIQTFEPKYEAAVAAFELSERQQIYSSLPKDVLQDALDDPTRTANIAVNEDGDVVAFFVLHEHYQHEGYDTPHHVVYIRSLSVNERFQGQGYGTKVMMHLPLYVQDLYPAFNHLYLVVDAENEAAWNVYERAGFMHAATKEEGPIGKERLYYLDLDSKYVSALRLQYNETSSQKGYDIINLVKDGTKVGFMALEAHDTRINIVAIEVIEAERHHGIAESALRQIATFIRRHYEDAQVIHMTLFGENDELRALCERSNFVETVATDDFVTFEKYVNY